MLSGSWLMACVGVGGDHRIRTLQCRLQGVPAEAGALHADGELRDAAEDGELAEGRRIGRGGAGHEGVELPEEPHDLLATLPLHRGGHHRGARLADGAARAEEAHVRDGVVVPELEPDGELVAAERIVALGLPVRVVHAPVNPRRTVVIEDHALVELAHRGHQANTFRTCRSPSTRASASAVVLYAANDARAVAPTPRRRISGWAQWWPAR